MSEERHAKVIYDIEHDERKARETQRAISATRKETRAVKEEAAIADRVFDRLGSQTGVLGDYMGESARQARELTDELSKVEAQAKDAGNAVETVGSGRGPQGGGRGGGDVLGRSDTALAALGTLGSSLDVAGAEFLSLGADVLGAVDAVKMLREATIAGEAASAAAATTSTAAAGGVGAFTAALGPIALVAGGAAVAFHFLSEAVSAAHGEAVEAVEARDKELADELRFLEIMRTMNAEQIQERLAYLKEDREKVREYRRESIADYAAAVEEGSDLFTQLLRREPWREYYDEQENLRVQAEDLTREINLLERAAGEMEAATVGLIPVLGDDAVDALGEFQAMLDQAAEAAKRRAAELERQREADQRVYERAVDAYIAYQDSLTDIQDRYAQGMIDAEAQYYRSLEQQTEDFHAAQIDLAREAADETAKITSDRARIEADADKALREGAEQFHKEMAQLQKRRHLEEYLDQLDHDASLRELALRRDVSGFIAEEEAFDRDQYRQDAEGRLDDEERRMQFEDAQRAIEDRRLQQLAANDQALADLQERISRENIALEVANEEKLAEIEAALDEEKARLKQAAIDQATARETAYNKQLADLNRSLSSETDLRAQYYAEWGRQASESFREFQGLMDQARAQTEKTMAEPLPTGRSRESSSVSGGAGAGPSVTVHSTVGDMATLSQVQDLARQTQRAVQTQAKRWQMLRNRL